MTGWRLLAPVRELLLADCPPEAEDRTRLVKLFLLRAAKGQEIGTGGWEEARDEVVAEAGNLDAMIGLSLRQTPLPQGVLGRGAGPRPVPCAYRPRFDRILAGGGEAAS